MTALVLTSADASDPDPVALREVMPRVTVVMPCLNESRTLAACIIEAQEALRGGGLDGEIIVADNGSSDGSQAIATALGARVVHVSERGYGAALRGGFAAARGEYVIMGDADCSYDFASIPRFVSRLDEGYGLVMGNRFRGGIAPSAMPWSHRYVGNPGLSWLGRRLFGSKVGDFYCGLRGFRREDFTRLVLRTSGMEFASEMVIQAALHGIRIDEIPTVLRKDGRDRPPHLRTWHDGWRSLRFMLLYSPRWLFLIPGALLLAFGLATSGWLVAGPHKVGQFGLDIHTLLVTGFMCIIGHEVLVFGAVSKVYCVREGLHPASPSLERLFQRVRLETGLAFGGALAFLGVALLVHATARWAATDFGTLDASTTMRETIPAVVLLALGVQSIFASFLLSVVGMHRTRPALVLADRDC